MRLPEIKPRKKYRFDEIIEAAATSARLCGVKMLAPQLDIDERYLHSKLTVSQSSSAHYLRADELIGIRLATGDLTSLQMEAELHDHLLVPRRDAEALLDRERMKWRQTDELQNQISPSRTRPYRRPQMGQSH